MPELPEVEIVRQSLHKKIKKKSIQKVIIRNRNLRFKIPSDFESFLKNKKIIEVSRFSKYLIIHFQNEDYCLIHLGMSGRILISGDPLGKFVHDHPAAQKHDHVVFDIDNGARVTFNDPRRFGAMDLLSTDSAEHHPLLRDIGPEPLSNAFNETYLIERVKGKNSAIKSFPRPLL